jgi:tetratricopeptide (TPR) repeat protein
VFSSWNPRALALAGVAVISLWFAACSKTASRPVERVAVLPVENLSADVSLDWMSRAASVIVTAEIAGSSDTYAFQVQAMRDAYAARATRVLHGYFSVVRGQLECQAVSEDLEQRKMVQELTASGVSKDGIVEVADSLARKLAGRVRPFGTKSPAAVREFVAAAEATTSAASADALRRALTQDPGFSEAHVALVQLLVSLGDCEAARRAIEAAQQSGSQLDEISRAQIEFLSATLESDSKARTAAVETLARLTPADPEWPTRLAEEMVRSRRYAEGVEWYSRAARADPSNGLLWNSLGYAQAYNGDLAGARKSFDRYAAEEPDSANPLDSLGEVNYRLGRFADAERFFVEAYNKNPDFLGGVALWKAAQARLMSGDLAGAEGIFRKYSDARKKAGDPLVDVRSALWQFITGRRREAIERLEDFARRSGVSANASSSAYAHLAVWSLETGQNARARQFALQAAETAQSPEAHNLASLCQLLASGPASAAEWATKAERVFPQRSQEALKKRALAYALLLSKNFAEAEPVFREIVNETHPFGAGPLRVLLAWTLAENGRMREAGELLQTYPIPNPREDSTFDSLVFPRLLFLRGVVLEKQGKRQEAVSSYRLFLKCSGDLPSVFGEEARARQALQPAA